MKNILKLLLILGLFFLQNKHSFGQDTLRLEKRPKVILKSWYPEFKELPKLKVGGAKILFTIIPDFEGKSINYNDINLMVKDDWVKIEKTEKINQFIVSVNETDLRYAEFEVWLDISNLTILLMENNLWTDIRQIYPYQNNRIMLQKVKLEIEK